jgi:AcrR family transcriptional regulator
MGYKERKIREKENIRNAIIRAARQIARNDGWNAVTIRKIADMVEYTPPIVYEYFEGKEGLLKQIINYGFEILKAEFERISTEIIDVKPLLKALSMSFWSFAVANPDLYQLMFRLEKTSPSEEIKSSMSFLFNTFYRISENNIQLTRELMFFWICLTQGAINILLFSVPPPPPDDITPPPPELLYEKLIDRFINSL